MKTHLNVNLEKARMYLKSGELSQVKKQIDEYRQSQSAQESIFQSKPPFTKFSQREPRVLQQMRSEQSKQSILEAENVQLRQSFQDISLQLEKSQKQKPGFSQLMSIKAPQLIDLQPLLQNKVSGISNKLEQMEGYLCTYQANTRRLCLENDEIKVKNALLIQEVQLVKDAKSALQGQNNQLREEIRQFQSGSDMVADLETKIKRLDDENKALKSSQDLVGEKLRNLGNEDSSSVLIEQQKQKIKQLEAEISEFHNTANVVHQNSEYDQKSKGKVADSYNVVVDGLKSQIQSLQDQISQIHAEKSESRAGEDNGLVKQLESQISQLQKTAKADSQATLIESQKQIIKDLEAQVSQLQVEAKIQQQQLDNYEGHQVKALQLKKSDALKHLEEDKAQYQQLLVEQKNSSSDEVKIGQVNNVNTELLDQIDKLKIQLSSYQQNYQLIQQQENQNVMLTTSKEQLISELQNQVLIQKQVIGDLQIKLQSTISDFSNECLKTVELTNKVIVLGAQLQQEISVKEQAIQNQDILQQQLFDSKKNNKDQIQLVQQLELQVKQREVETSCMLDQIAALQTDTQNLDQSKSEKLQLLQTTQKLQLEVSELKQQVAIKINEISVLQSQIQDSKKQMENQETAQQEALNIMNQLNQAVQQKFENVNEMLKSEKMENEALIQQIAFLKQQLEEKESAAEVSKNSVLKMEASRNDCIKLIQSKDSELEQQKLRMQQSISQQNDAQSQQIITLQSDLARKNDVIDSQQQQLNTMLVVVSDLTKQRDSLKIEVNSLEKLVDKNQCQKQNYLDLRTSLSSDLHLVKEKAIQLKIQIKQYDIDKVLSFKLPQFKVSNNENGKLEQKIKTLEDEQATLLSNLNKQKQLVKQLEFQLSDLEANQTSPEDVKDMELKIKTLSQEKERFIKQLDEKDIRLNKLSTEVMSLESANKKLSTTSITQKGSGGCLSYSCDDFLSYYASLHQELDYSMIDTPEIDQARVIILKELKSQKAVCGWMAESFIAVVKAIDDEFIDTQKQALMCEKFRIEYNKSKSNQYVTALKNFIHSKYNMAMEAYWNQFLQLFFLDHGKMLFRKYADDQNISQMLFNICNCICLYIIQDFHVVNFDATDSSKMVIFPQLLRDRDQRIVTALQIKIADLVEK